jgi:hypothetical protein
MASSSQDLSQESARVRQMLDYILAHLRERRRHLGEARAQSVFDHAVETLEGLQEEFAAFTHPRIVPFPGHAAAASLADTESRPTSQR